MTLIDSYHFHGLDFELHGQHSTQAPHPGLAMSISSNFCILGGGAIVETAGEGNLLWASYPVSYKEWEARAKDHEVSSPGMLFVYCIAASIRPADYTIVQNTTPAPTNHPKAEAILPGEFVLVGGGARANWDGTGGPGSLLYACRPGTGESWFAAAKDHRLANPATVTAYAIGVRGSILDSLGLKVVRFRANSVTAVAEPSVAGGPGDEREATLISGGAETHWTGSGSLLTACSPDVAWGGPLPTRPYAWLARGKDHLDSDPATITAWSLALVKYG